MKTDKLIQAAVIGFLTLAATNTIAATTSETEKCYGIVKAGMNDCATAKQSCAGSSTKDKQADAFVLVPQGLCDKIVGGVTKTEK